uniref:Uncharacterized protein LOC114340568 n=1 Tax=Diabrotica virgifera virgifera TaxID=50390 RepID=A0A6P7GCN5_DIAVI
MEKWCFCLFLLFIWFVSARGANNSEYPDLRPEWSYCYEFTWFGPDYNNVSTYNNTCADYLDETRAEGIPCAAPIVISYDGTLPDMQYLWDNHKESVLCKRSINQMCVKYTYLFNQKIENITYMCSKVQHEGGGNIDSGCYKQKLERGYETEVCVCQSSNGIYPPCNRSVSIFGSINVFLVFGILWLFVYKLF